MTDYARGIEQASALYKEVIQGCKLENDKLRELVRDMWREMIACPDYRFPPCVTADICEYMRELGIEVVDDDNTASLLG